MNAGRGKKFHKSISDHILQVTALNLNTMLIEEMDAVQCDFSHRHSIFQTKDYIILSARMRFSPSSKEEVEKGILERLQTSKQRLDAGKPSCGSIFCKANGYIMQLLKGLRIGGACWSRKTSNWISNDRQGSYRDIVKLIWVTRLLHKATFQQIRQEVEIWR